MTDTVGKMRLEAPSNRVLLAQPGVLDHAAVMAFVQGQCHGLALALHARTGWSIVAIEDAEGECLHVCVRDELGRLVDVTGAHAEAEMVRGASAREIDVAYIRSLEVESGWAAADQTAASLWVDAVLSRVESGERLPARSSDTLTVLGPWGPRRELRVLWSGDPWVDVEVRRVDGPWVGYCRVTFPADPETGTFTIDFTVEELRRVAAQFVSAQFDERKAERVLASVG